MKLNSSLTSVAVACALFAISTTGCGNKAEAPATDAPASTPAATTPAAPVVETAAPAPTTGGTAEGTTKTVTITNQTTFDVNYIYLSPIEETTWGDDILGENDVLKPGASIEVEITCGKWDAQLVAVDGSKCEVDAVDICSSDIWNVTADC